MTEGTDPKVESARRLLGYSKAVKEKSIQTEIVNLLRNLDPEKFDTIEEETSTSGKRMDIYLPRLRVILETKRVGRAGIEVLGQLEPYVQSKILDEQNYLPLEGHEQDRAWTGIITDGKVWHIWKWHNHANAEARRGVSRSGFRTPESLLEFIEGLFQEKPLGKPRIPQSPYDLFKDDLEDLKDIHRNLSDSARMETRTKFELWQDMLRASGMEPKSDVETLFVKHSFLVSTARNVSSILTLKDPEQNPNAILNDGFVSWIVQDPDGEDWQRDFLAKINLYDWRRQKGDVLRSVYEGFISPTDRKIFGEHYTPDWLAELLVNETLDPEWLETSIKAAQSKEPLDGIGVLDPACGSGTFLYHAARKILESETMRKLCLPPSRQAEIAVRLVHGIDIHPIAAEISRATLLRALPAPPPDGAKSVRVFQGDSLMTFQDRQDSSKPLLDQMRHKIREKNLSFYLPGKKPREIRIPISFCRLPSFNFEMDRLIEFAKRNEIPQDILEKIPEEDQSSLEQCCKDFAEVIVEKGNSVWAWYVTNITAPAFLARRKINRIVANPPWVKMSNIQVPYRKKELENVFKNESLWSGGKMAPHNDIAQLFVKNCRNLYLISPQKDPAAWIVKKSALKSSQWEKFRKWHSSFLAQTVDLTEPKPFGGGCAKEAIVFFEIRPASQNPALKKLVSSKAVVMKNQSKAKSPDNYHTIKDLENISEFIKSKKKIPESASEYHSNKWTQGASIVPSTLVIVGSIGARANGNTNIKTHSSMHKPWKDLGPYSGEIPSNWLRSLFKGADMLPFMLSRSPNLTIVPIDEDNKIPSNPQEESIYWKKADSVYKKYRGKSSPENLISRINYQKSLDNQISRKNNLKNRTVLYPSAGNIMRASRATLTQNMVIDSSMFFQTFKTAEEAAYLVSILNNPGLTEAFANARRSDRHFQTFVWKCLPIPKYDPKSKDHKRLAGLCVEAETAAEAWYAPDPEHAGYGQQKASKEIRKILQENGIFDQVNTICRKILPSQIR